MKTFLYFIYTTYFISFISLNVHAKTVCDCAEIIVNNSEKILFNLDNCTTNTPNLTHKCKFIEKSHHSTQFERLLELLKSPFTKSPDNCNELAKLYKMLYYLIAYTNNGTLLISDTITIDFLISSLQCDDINFACWSCHILFKRVPFEILKKNSSRIKNSLEKGLFDTEEYSKEHNWSDKYKLLSLLELSSEEKKELLKMYMKVELKARLGDKKAEDKLIKTYLNCKEYRRRESYTKKMIMAGTDRCIKILIKTFNDPYFNIEKYKTAPPCTLSTIRVPIMEGLRRLHYKNKIINDELYTLLNDPAKKYLNRDLVASFFKKFLIWAEKEYGVKPDKPTPPPVIYHFSRGGF